MLTDEDFLIERVAKTRSKYNGILPIEAVICHLRLAVDKAGVLRRGTRPNRQAGLALHASAVFSSNSLLL